MLQNGLSTGNIKIKRVTYNSSPTLVNLQIDSLYLIHCDFYSFMRKIYSLVIILFLLASVMTSNTGCKRDKPIFPDSLRVSKGSLSFKVNGFQKKATFIQASVYTDSDIQILATIDKQKSEGLSVNLTKPKVGTFDMAAGNFIATYTEKSSDPEKSFIGTEGAITITSLSENIIRGTFEFEATNASGTETRIITDGKFECKLTKIK